MMTSYLFWNSWAIGTLSRRLKKLVSKLRRKVLAIAMPMVNHSRIVIWRDRLRFENSCSNVDVGGKLWNFWAQDIDLTVKCMRDQF